MVGTEVIGALLQSAVIAALPLMMAGLGELVSERAGVVNLGVEGTMLAGAASGFVVVTATNSLWMGMLEVSWWVCCSQPSLGFAP